MTAWREGYVADVAYTTGFYREVSPAWLHQAAEITGTRAPDPETPLTVCDLGCGQGFTTLALAAQYPLSTFHGIDFNAAQIAGARDLAAAADVPNVHFHELSFQQAPHAGLPLFDVVVLHGVYAWIGETNKAAVVRFLAEHLKPGGLVYISYNAMPGWAAVQPVQRLLVEHADRHPGRSDRRVREGLDHVAALREAGVSYFTANPAAGKRLDSLARKDDQYLAHEFLNRDWAPLYHTDVRRDLAAAGLDHAGSAALLENFEALMLPDAVREQVHAAPDGGMAELLKDMAINQHFRRDLFVKGRRPLTAQDESRAVRARHVTLLRPRDEVTFTVQTPLGEAAGDSTVYAGVCDALADGVTRVGDILARTGLDLPRVHQALAVLCASGQAHTLRADVPEQATAAAQRVNAVVAERVMAGESYAHLAAPALGSALPAGLVSMAAYDALRRGGVADAEQLGEAIWTRLRRRGSRLLRDGEPVEGEDANRAEAVKQAQRLLTVTLPRWRRLGAI